MINMTIQDQLRAQYVNRWNTVHLTHSQSLAEHTFNVAMIARHIAILLGLEHMMSDILEYALVHDLDEIRTGDIPTPTKRRIGGKSILKALNIYTVDEPNALAVTVVKTADVIETTFHIWQHAAGVHAKQVREHCVNEMDGYLNGIAEDEKELYNAAVTVWVDLCGGERTW